jgi:hypothetical protein
LVWVCWFSGFWFSWFSWFCFSVFWFWFCLSWPFRQTWAPAFAGATVCAFAKATVPANGRCIYRHPPEWLARYSNKLNKFHQRTKGTPEWPPTFAHARAAWKRRLPKNSLKSLNTAAP